MTSAAPELDPTTRDALAELVLSLADDEFVIGFWDSEWTGIAPMLEEDVATSSIAQDEIGHARALYELLAELTGDDADAIAYGREPEAYRHASLLDHERGDWAATVARRYLYETADAVRLAALASSVHEPLALLAAKMRREETYHLLHAEALRRLWPDAQDVFSPLLHEEALVSTGVLPTPMRALHAEWVARVRPTLEPVAGDLRESAPRIDGRERRSDAFRWLHGELTWVARSGAGAIW
jgi:ring-1,2-phenylacetyl-CoA epoxidase subunit PaaC